MSNDRSTMRQEMIALLGRIVGEEPLPPDLQRRAFEIFASLMGSPASAEHPGAFAESRLAGLGGVSPLAAATSAGVRRLVYVHGICAHSARFSDPWWNALSPFVSNTFGPGILGQTRREVVWSDIVNDAATALGAQASESFGMPPAEQARQRASEEIREALRDRADQRIMMQAALRTEGSGAVPLGASELGSLISIPGLNCVDDFAIYLTSNGTRQQIVDRFTAVVRPLIQAGDEIDVISHSWGTVVAYEGLRQLADEGFGAPRIRNLFTVGAALSIGPVKSRLRAANRDGQKPANVRRWINLDAHGDLVGGPLQGRPFAVDFDFVNLEAVGCASFLGIVNPSCAHSSYFNSANQAVNQGIFASFIGTA